MNEFPNYKGKLCQGLNSGRRDKQICHSDCVMEFFFFNYGLVGQARNLRPACVHTVPKAHKQRAIINFSNEIQKGPASKNRAFKIC